MALRIGITGGIGSGKTTVARIFSTLGIPVYSADEHARRLMVEDADLIEALRTLLGPRTFLPDGQLNRPYVAEQIFGDADKLAAVNQLVHPAVGRDGLAWHQRQKQVAYTLYEAALLYESGHADAFDAIIVVAAPEALRIRRVLERDQSDEAAVRARMARQWSQDEKVAKADFIIHNDGEQLLLPQVLRIHADLRNRAAAER